MQFPQAKVNTPALWTMIALLVDFFNLGDPQIEETIILYFRSITTLNKSLDLTLKKTCSNFKNFKDLIENIKNISGERPQVTQPHLAMSQPYMQKNGGS